VVAKQVAQVRGEAEVAKSEEEEKVTAAAVDVEKGKVEET
jgi:hypothetical protein